MKQYRVPARHLRSAPRRLCVGSTVITGRSRGLLSHRFVHIHGGPVTAGCLSAAFPYALAREDERGYYPPALAGVGPMPGQPPRSTF